jgi:hypothetical protein
MGASKLAGLLPTYQALEIKPDQTTNKRNLVL